MKKWQFIFVLMLGLILVGATACSPGGEPVSRQLAEVTRGDLSVNISGTGNTEVANEARLAFGSPGKIAKIYVEEGDSVVKDEVLAELDAGALELVVAQAELALRMAEYSLDQALELYTWPDIKIAQADVDDAEAYYDYVTTNLAAATTEGQRAMWSSALIYAQIQLATAEAKLDAMVRSYDTEEVQIERMKVDAATKSLAEAQKQLDETIITTPLGGVVASVDAEEGDLVSNVVKVIHVVDLSSMELKVEVDEIDIAEVEVGQKAVIELDALPDLLLEGKVISISLLPAVGAGIITYTVTISLDSPANSGVRVGMSATADIIINEQTNILLVPSRAIRSDDQGNEVVDVLVNEQVEQRTVITGISDGIETEIINGLSEGETVVIETRASATQTGLF